jgi:hypothetical protein
MCESCIRHRVRCARVTRWGLLVPSRRDGRFAVEGSRAQMARRVAGVKPGGAAIVRCQASPLIKPNRLPHGNAEYRGQWGIVMGDLPRRLGTVRIGRHRLQLLRETSGRCSSEVPLLRDGRLARLDLLQQFTILVADQRSLYGCGITFSQGGFEGDRNH